MIALDLILGVLAAALALPCMVLLVECLAAPLDLVAADAHGGLRPRVVVLVPAHNEAEGIAGTVAALCEQLGERDRLLVVADNCTDDTAVLARKAGAEVIERHDAVKMGKGYALAFAVAHLRSSPPDVVVVVDADCRVAKAGVAQLADRAICSGRPVQAEYLLQPTTHPRGAAALGALALIVRNQVRPRGLHRLGLPCPLTGSGMAFPWPLLRDAPALEGNLVEDMVLGIELALRGMPPLACPTVSVISELPSGAQVQLRQRRRWEHGHLATVRSHGFRLLWSGLMQSSGMLLAMALDLMVPPLALLAMLLGLAGSASTLSVAIGGSSAPLGIVATSVFAVSLAVAVSWSRFARVVLPLRALATIPLYLLWKVPIYAGYFLRGRTRRWERTVRPGEESTSRTLR